MKKSKFLLIIISIIVLAIVFLVYLLNNSKTCLSSFEFSKNEKRIDSVFVKLDKLFNQNPDSAITLALITENELKNSAHEHKLIVLYAYLSEIYQFRKKNDSEALKYINLALDIISKHPEYSFSNPYLYVNAGNILFRYEEYEKAIEVYREIQKVMEGDEPIGFNSLINNNIALSFQKMNMCDSAEFYFLKAKITFEDTGHMKYLLYMQHNQYMMSLLNQCNRKTETVSYFRSSREIMTSIEFFFHISNSINEEELRFKYKPEFYSYYSECCHQMGNCHFSQKRYTAAISLLHEALEYSVKAKNDELSAKNHYLLSEILLTKSQPNQSLAHVDSAITLLHRSTNFEMLADVYLQKANISRATNDHIMAAFCTDSAKVYSEKAKIQVEKRNNENINQLAYVPINISLRNAEKSKHEQSKTIRMQELAIFYLIVLLFVLISALISTIFLLKKLKRTQKTLALKTIQIVEADIKHDQEDMNIDMQLIQLFEKHIISTKHYLNTGITLLETAEIVQSNRSYVSRMINRNYGMSFTDYINNLRVNEACRILIENRDPNFTIDHLYSDVGFSGKSTFYSAFKKFTGVTPAAFQKIQSKEKSS